MNRIKEKKQTVKPDPKKKSRVRRSPANKPPLWKRDLEDRLKLLEISPPKSAPLIYKQISLIMVDIEAVGKDQEFKAEKYGFKFRGIDDVYNALHDAMGEHKVFSTSKILKKKTDEKANKYNNLVFMHDLTIEYTFWAEDGSHVSTEVVGVGHDQSDKSANKAMAVGHKYALLQIFCIPTEEKKDPEHDAQELVSNGLKSSKNAPNEEKKKAEIPANKNKEEGKQSAGAGNRAQFRLHDGKNVWMNRYDLLGLFQDVKKLVGEEEYYISLEKFGVTKSNQIKTAAHFQTIYQDLMATAEKKGTTATVDAGISPEDAAQKATKLISIH